MCRIEVNTAERELLEAEIKGQNNLNILKFDIIRQKNISKESKNVD